MTNSVTVSNDEMRAEYDFSGGVRGKHFRALREEGFVLQIENDDGSVSKRIVPGERMIVLEPDVYEYFPDAESVNRALRTLIALVPNKRQTA